MQMPENQGTVGIGYGIEFPMGAREKQSTLIYYAAFLLDPDGNNIEAVFRG